MNRRLLFKRVRIRRNKSGKVGRQLKVNLGKRRLEKNIYLDHSKGSGSLEDVQ